MWYRILAQVRLNRANAFGFLVPIFGLALGMIFYQESFGALVAMGAVLTILVDWR